MWLLKESTIRKSKRLEPIDEEVSVCTQTDSDDNKSCVTELAGVKREWRLQDGTCSRNNCGIEAGASFNH
ncbi:hypothetical protein TNCV_5118501 [Trichonephila clavipes]|nr:hypothetical protein TNCV_5118501 [Trichonephila clavipes]